MKLFNQGRHTSSAVSYAGLIEKIEILRSTLRWASTLERPEIEKLLRQSGALRDEVMQLSHKERFVQAALAEPVPADQSPGERRQALLDRSFVFDGAFGDNPKLLEALEIAEKAAPTDLPVLIDGESGTGQGADGEGHPRQRVAGRQALCLGQLRSDPRQPAGVRVVRPQEGGLHRRRQRSEGQVRKRSRGNDIPRRDRRAAAFRAGEVAARARIARDSKGGIG